MYIRAFPLTQKKPPLTPEVFKPCQTEDKKAERAFAKLERNLKEMAVMLYGDGERVVDPAKIVKLSRVRITRENATHVSSSSLLGFPGISSGSLVGTFRGISSKELKGSDTVERLVMDIGKLGWLPML
eukprot:1367682-Amorphochlora_amoeboformis.AAC.1